MLSDSAQPVGAPPLPRLSRRPGRLRWCTHLALWSCGARSAAGSRVRLAVSRWVGVTASRTRAGWACLPGHSASKFHAACWDSRYTMVTPSWQPRDWHRSLPGWPRSAHTPVPHASRASPAGRSPARCPQATPHASWAPRRCRCRVQIC